MSLEYLQAMTVQSPLEDQTYTLNRPFCSYLYNQKSARHILLLKWSRKKKKRILVLLTAQVLNKPTKTQDVHQITLRKNTSSIWGKTTEANMNNSGKATGKNAKAFLFFLWKLEKKKKDHCQLLFVKENRKALAFCMHSFVLQCLKWMHSVSYSLMHCY